jgi:hypothetical protein
MTFKGLWEPVGAGLAGEQIIAFLGDYLVPEPQIRLVGFV